MDNIQSIQDFRKLTPDERKKIYDSEITRIETYIYDSPWYKSKSRQVKKIIRKHKPWLLYQNAIGLTPVRLVGFVEYDGGAGGAGAGGISYIVATMDDEKKNELTMGQIQDINRIRPIHWSEIDDRYIMDLITARYYGGDMIFLKPEMFLLLGSD
jgi:hypothetical protein